MKRCDRILQDYEEKLKLVARFEKIKEKISCISQLSEGFEEDLPADQDQSRQYIAQIRQISAEILQEL